MRARLVAGDAHVERSHLSIRAPVRARRHGVGVLVGNAAFNSRAREGATSAPSWLSTPNPLSIRAPVRARRPARLQLPSRSAFNSRAREGATRTMSRLKSSRRSFNSRAREGATVVRLRRVFLRFLEMLPRSPSQASFPCGFYSVSYEDFSVFPLTAAA